MQVPDLREALKQHQDGLPPVDCHDLADLEPVCPPYPLPLPSAPSLSSRIRSGAPRTAPCNVPAPQLLLQMERESQHLGGVEFLHLMRVVYPYANQDDLEAFRSWTCGAQILRVSG